MGFVLHLGSASRSPQHFRGEFGDGDFGFTANVVNLSFPCCSMTRAKSINEIAHIRKERVCDPSPYMVMGSWRRARVNICGMTLWSFLDM